MTSVTFGEFCTNIPESGIPGVPGSDHPQFIDVGHREHANRTVDRAIAIRQGVLGAC